MTKNWTHPINHLSELREWLAVIWKCRFDLDEYLEPPKNLNLFIYDQNWYLKVWHINP